MHSMWMHVLHHLLLGVPTVTAYALAAAALALTASTLALAASALRATLWPGLCWLLPLGLYGQ